MCGRYTLYNSPTDLAKHFSATLQYSFSKSYNIAPTSIIPVLIELDHERLILPMRWGLIPAWHKEEQKLTVLNNAKIETVDTKPSFRSSFKRHRCLIMTDGFYEWDSTTKPKQPYYFHRKDNQPFALAGIWDRWVSGDKSVDSCCIITEAANDIVSTVHERMPAIITPENYDKWLNLTLQDPSQIKDIAMQPNAYVDITTHPVTSKMNRVAYNNSHCIEKINISG